MHGYNFERRNREICSYGPVFAAEAAVECARKAAVKESFRLIVAYIFGANETTSGIRSIPLDLMPPFPGKACENCSRIDSAPVLAPTVVAPQISILRHQPRQVLGHFDQSSDGVIVGSFQSASE